ncbi:hypothetical protein ACLK10_23050 [Escherichia coli]
MMDGNSGLSLTQEVIDEAVDFRQAMARLYKEFTAAVTGSSNRGTRRPHQTHKPAKPMTLLTHQPNRRPPFRTAG